jgi:nondiscriminating aspartyl-tRNA synthetase
VKEMERDLIQELYDENKKHVNVIGWIEKIRNLGGIEFLIIKDRSGDIQALKNKPDEVYGLLKKNDIVEVSGELIKDKRAPHGSEIRINKLDIISSSKKQFPLSEEKDSREKLETLLDYRPVSLRRNDIADVFRIQSELINIFRQNLREKGHVEVFTPKICSGNAEGGALQFRLDYFGRKAFLAQSPQIYKQILVGTPLERVFEVGPAFRAELHNTKRHLNEYTSMDVEQAFVKGSEELMNLEEELVNSFMNYFNNKEGKELSEKHNYSIPTLKSKIPRLKYEEVEEILKNKYDKRCSDKGLDTESERYISDYVKKELDSDFVFITDFPTNSRPFYTKKSKETGLTESFDLLCRGLEVSTGGERISDLDELVSNMKQKNIGKDSFKPYLMAFEYGMPPHGGFAFGAERLTISLLGLNNIRKASLFPRDLRRLNP